jgi:hypothetical protein
MVKLVGYFDNIKGPSSVEHAFFLQRKKPICFQNRVPGYIFLSEALNILGKHIYKNDWTGIEIETSVCFNEWQTNDILFDLDFLGCSQTFSNLRNEFPFLKNKTNDEIVLVLKNYSSAHTRFREARQKLRIMLQGELDSFLLEDSGRQFKISETVWAGIYAEEIFKVVGDCGIADTGSGYPYFGDGYEEINYLSTDDLYESLPLGRRYCGNKREGSVIVNKAELESLLAVEGKKNVSFNFEESLNAETIIKFLEGRGGYVSPRLKGLLMYICESTLEKDAGQDKVKEAFYNWLKNNHEKCGFDKKRFEDLTSKKRKGHPQSSHEGQYYDDISRILRL